MTIGDLPCIAKSPDTFDIRVFDLANCEKLCGLLNLYYMQGSFFFPYNYQSRGEWFCGYLSSFVDRGEKCERYEKLLTNPVIRILKTGITEKIKALNLSIIIE
jgi:hypothetical protein